MMSARNTDNSQMEKEKKIKILIINLNNEHVCDSDTANKDENMNKRQIIKRNDG